MWIVSKRLYKGVYHDSRCKYANKIYKYNRKILGEQELANARYKLCKYCNSIHFYIHTYREEIESFCASNNYEYDIINYHLFIRTNISCWRIVYLKKERVFVLYHRNHTNRHITRDEILQCGYHRQKDVSEKKLIQEFFDYIKKHDTFRTENIGIIKNYPGIRRNRKSIIRRQNKEVGERG